MYSQYGFPKEDIATLYLAGFSTAVVAGMVLGPLADNFGRRRAALAYCLLTAGVAVTKHFASYRVLLLGRVLGGFAASLLYLHVCENLRENTAFAL